MLRFAHPEALWLLLALPPLVWLGLRRVGAAKRLLERHGRWPGASRLLEGWAPGRMRALELLSLAGLALLLAALAAPQLGTKLVEVERKGVDVVVAVDVSQSMAAQDLAPDRMARARHSIRRLLRELSGDRVALVPFAGRAFLQNPLTSDYELVAMLTDLLRPGLIPVPGTDLGAPIRTALEAFGQGREDGADGDGRDRVLIVLSDGEDFEGDWPAALEEARAAGVTIHAVGLASPEGAPVPDPERPGAYKTDASGGIVLSKLDESTLARLAEEGGGLYLRSTPAGDELVKIRERLDELEGRSLGTRVYSGWRERFQLPLGLGLALLLAGWLWPAAPVRRRRAAAALLLLLLPQGLRAQSAPTGSTPLEGAPPALAAAPASATLSATGERPGWLDGQRAGGAIREGNRLFEDGDAGAAAERYGRALALDPSQPVARFNLGGALAASGDTEGAARQWSALSDQPAMEQDPGLASATWYNRGTLALAHGDAAAARDALVEALRRNPASADAKRNLELALRQLQQQQEQQNQQNQDQDQDQQDKQKQDQQQKKQDQDRQPQDQQPQDQQPQDQQPQDQQQQDQQPQDQQPQDQQRQDQQPQPQRQPSQEPQGADSSQAQPRPLRITPEQMEQILQAAAAAEKATMEEQMQQRVPADARRVEKDW